MAQGRDMNQIGSPLQGIYGLAGKMVAVVVNICPRLKACLIHMDWSRGLL